MLPYQPVFAALALAFPCPPLARFPTFAVFSPELLGDFFDSLFLVFLAVVSFSFVEVTSLGDFFFFGVAFGFGDTFFFGLGWGETFGEGFGVGLGDGVGCGVATGS